MKVIREGSLSISSTVKSAPRIDGALFERMKDKVLGKSYDLSLVFVGKIRAQKLNKEHRQKNYATDILSFEIDENMGEIVIHPPAALKKAAEFGRTFENYLKFLFIHGLFHLKGFDHSSRMESEEQKIRRIFKI